MKTVFLTTAAWLTAEWVLANGGGYSHRGVSETGTIVGFEPSDTEKVRILDEQLNIAVTRDEARVHVRYILKNTSKQRANVRFSFPVEELSEPDPFEEPAATPDPKSKAKAKPLYCRDYRVDLAGKALAATFEPEPKDAPADPRLTGIKGWMISKMSLDPGEEKTMNITYHGDYPFSDYSVSDDGSVSAKNFKYRFSTGACWDGPIEHGTVVIKQEGVNPDEIKFLKPANRFHKSGDHWEWTFENLKPTLADDLNVEVSPRESYFHGSPASGAHPEVTRFLERDGKWSALHHNYRVTASSTLPPQGHSTYSAENIKSWDAPWSEGAPGNGVGEWLELTPEVPKPLLSIRITPGYASSKELFKANPRPKRLEILLNGEHSFETTLADSETLQTVPVIGYAKPVRKIRLIIKDVYPGSRFEDCCISMVALETALSKKPQIHPSR